MVNFIENHKKRIYHVTVKIRIYTLAPRHHWSKPSVPERNFKVTMITDFELRLTHEEKKK